MDTLDSVYIFMAKNFRDSAKLIFAPLREFVADRLTGGESHMNLLSIKA